MTEEKFHDALAFIFNQKIAKHEENIDIAFNNAFKDWNYVLTDVTDGAVEIEESEYAKIVRKMKSRLRLLGNKGGAR